MLEMISSESKEKELDLFSPFDESAPQAFAITGIALTILGACFGMGKVFSAGLALGIGALFLAKEQKKQSEIENLVGEILLLRFENQALAQNLTQMIQDEVGTQEPAKEEAPKKEPLPFWISQETQ